MYSVRSTRSPTVWVSPFRHPRITACLTAPRGFSQSSHVFRRFSAPEHPPCTLTHLTSGTLEHSAPELTSPQTRSQRTVRSLSKLSFENFFARSCYQRLLPTALRLSSPNRRSSSPRKRRNHRYRHSLLKWFSSCSSWIEPVDAESSPPRRTKARQNGSVSTAPAVEPEAQAPTPLLLLPNCQRSRWPALPRAGRRTSATFPSSAGNELRSSYMLSDLRTRRLP